MTFHDWHSGAVLENFEGTFVSDAYVMETHIEETGRAFNVLGKWPEWRNA